MLIVLISENPLFQLGEVVATQGGQETLERLNINVAELLNRHISGDWSDMSEEDQEENQRAVKEGTRVFSAYLLPPDNTKIWVITEWDRSVTTILLPEEY